MRSRKCCCADADCQDTIQVYRAVKDCSIVVGAPVGKSDARPLLWSKVVWLGAESPDLARLGNLTVKEFWIQPERACLHSAGMPAIAGRMVARNP